MTFRDVDPQPVRERPTPNLFVCVSSAETMTRKFWLGSCLEFELLQIRSCFRNFCPHKVLCLRLLVDMMVADSETNADSSPAPASGMMAFGPHSESQRQCIL